MLNIKIFKKLKRKKLYGNIQLVKKLAENLNLKNICINSYNILATLVKEIMFVLKIQKGLGFEIICDKTKNFIENYLFGQKVEFDSETTKANLCSLETRKTIIETMSNEIKKVIIDERSETIISKIFQFSEDKSRELKTLKKHYISNQRKAYDTNTF